MSRWQKVAAVGNVGVLSVGVKQSLYDWMGVNDVFFMKKTTRMHILACFFEISPVFEEIMGGGSENGFIYPVLWVFLINFSFDCPKHQIL